MKDGESINFDQNTIAGQLVKFVAPIDIALIAPENFVVSSLDDLSRKLEDMLGVSLEDLGKIALETEPGHFPPGSPQGNASYIHQHVSDGGR